MKIVFVESIGVSERLLTETKQYFEEAGHDFEYYPSRTENADEIIRRVGDAEIMTVSNIPITKKIIKACKNLKLINVAFTGVDHIDLKACSERNISVCNASGYATIAVTELTLGLALGLLRNIPEMNFQTRNLKGRDNYLGTEMFGKTVGVVGTGAIGISVAQMFFNFGCNILAYSKTKKPLYFVKYVSLKDIFSKSDIISLHIPLNSETKNLINEDLLSLMKPTAILINTARGQIINYDALSKMLKENRIAGAAIDVYETEPPIPEKHPILSAPNTVLLPHLGYATEEAMLKRLNIVIKNIESFFEDNLQNKII
jgi:D-3-phosphoglycerate dehydrogenase